MSRHGMNGGNFQFVEGIHAEKGTSDTQDPPDKRVVMMTTPAGYTVHRYSRYYPKGVVETRDKRKVSPRQLMDLASACGCVSDEGSWQSELERATEVRSLWEGERLVGFGMVVQEGNRLIFDRAFVHPDYQTTGAFQTMFGKGIASVLATRSYQLYVRADSDRVELYKRLGWQEVTPGQ